MRKLTTYLLALGLPLLPDIYACSCSARSGTSANPAPTTRVVERYQEEQAVPGDTAWEMARRVSGEKDPAKIASLVNRAVKHTVGEKGGPRRLLSDTLAMGLDEYGVTVPVHGPDGIMGDELQVGDRLYFPVSSEIAEEQKPLSEQRTLSFAEVYKGKLKAFPFLQEMGRKGYWFSHENWNEFSQLEFMVKSDDEIWLGPSLKDIESRFPPYKGNRIRTGYLKITPSGLVLALAADVADGIAKSVAERHGIKVKIETIC